MVMPADGPSFGVAPSGTWDTGWVQAARHKRAQTAVFARLSVILLTIRAKQPFFARIFFMVL
jgi:hypothetical protein